LIFDSYTWSAANINYFSVEGNVTDGAGGFLIAMAHELTETTLRFGVACVARTASSGENVEATGISEFQWCPGAPGGDGATEVRLVP
jgi:hypothetical protein